MFHIQQGKNNKQRSLFIPSPTVSSQTVNYIVVIKTISIFIDNAPLFSLIQQPLPSLIMI